MALHFSQHSLNCLSSVTQYDNNTFHVIYRSRAALSSPLFVLSIHCDLLTFSIRKLCFRSSNGLWEEKILVQYHHMKMSEDGAQLHRIKFSEKRPAERHFGA